MRIDDALLHPARNNLTLTRLILATSVIYTHSWAHFVRNDTDNLKWLLGSPVSHHGVDGFFVLSGFLVYRSLVQNNSLPRFALARYTRLVPGLAVMLLLVTALGAFITSLPLASYATSKYTLAFVFLNTSLVWPAYQLPGIACPGDPCPINESLWTLPWEARCYVGLALLALLGLARRRPILLLILPASFAYAIGWSLVASHPRWLAALGPGVVFYASTLARLWTAFALGILAYELRERIPLSWVALAALLLIDLALQHYAPAFGIPARQVLCAYAVLCLGFLSARRGSISARWPDCSYGMYIYAFPVMLAAASLLPLDGPYKLALATVALTAVVAIASWYLVEKPALDWLRRRQNTAYAALGEPEDYGEVRPTT